MNRTQAKKFRSERARELRGLADILAARGLVRSPDPLREAAGMCCRDELNGRLHWDYAVVGLAFKVDDAYRSALRNTRPDGLVHLEFELHVVLSGDCADDGDTCDPFRRLTVDCVVRALGAEGEHFCAWHLDRHIGELSAESQEFAHPIYHFQFGGHRLPKMANFGQHLILEAPRIAHPPMDAVLAVDFILSNYYAKAWLELRKDGAYSHMVREAQKRFWRPYAHAAALHWNPVPAESKWEPRYVWPQLVPASPAGWLENSDE